MKKLLLFGLIYFYSFTNLLGQCGLDVLGGANFITNAVNSEIAIAADGTVYSFSFDSQLGKFNLKSNLPFNSWTQVASLTASTLVKPVLKISKTGKVYVFISDNSAGQVGKVFFLTGSTFTQLGSSVSGSNKIADLTMAFDGAGGEYVAYKDITNNNMSTVKKWDGSSWVDVGTGVVSTGVANYNSLIIDKNGNPVIAFEDTDLANVNIMKFSGGIWSSIHTTGISESPTNIKLRIGQNGDFYLGYVNYLNEAKIERFDGTSWSNFGTAITNIDGTSANTFDLALDPADLPYVIAVENSSLYTVTYRYSYVLSDWENVLGTYLNSTTTSNVSVAVNKTGVPFFYFYDSVVNGGNIKAMAANFTISSQPPSITTCNGSPSSLNVVMGVGTPIGYKWQIESSGIYINTSAPYTNFATSTLNFTATPSQNQNIQRCVISTTCRNVISNSATITVNSPSLNISTIQPTCFSTCDGQLTANASGGVGPYTYSWTPSGTTATLPGLCAGTYSLEIRDANNCKASASSNIVPPSSISSSISGNLTICQGASTSLTVNAAGGTPGYSYNWSPGTTLNITNSAVVIATPTITTTYTATTIDANSCSKTFSVTVIVNSLPSVNLTPTQPLCFASCNGMLSATAFGGLSPYTYSWSPSGQTTSIISGLCPGTYSLQVKDANNCSTTASNNIFSPPSLSPSISGNSAVCIGASATLTANISGGTPGYTYNWTPSSSLNNSINQVVIATPTITTIYTVTITDANGCFTTSTKTVIVNTLPTITLNSPTICQGNIASLNASGANSFTWNPGNLIGSVQNVSPSITTTYSVVGTNTLTGCSNTSSTTVIVNPLPTANAGSTQTLTCSNTTATLSGSGGSSFNWAGLGITSGSLTANAIVNLPGTYSLTVSNAGCSSPVATVAVIQDIAAPIVNSSNSGTLTCSTTTVNATVTTTTSPVFYSWSGPGITSSMTLNTITLNKGGTYNYTVTNSLNNCSTLGFENITQNTITPTVILNPTNVSCNSLCDGAITSTVSGGTGPYTYSWSPTGATTQNLTSLCAGNYTLIVTGANGCAITNTRTVTQPAVLTTNISGNQTICNGEATTLSANTSGGAGAYTYSWSPNISLNSTVSLNVNANPTSSQVYNLVSTDANGCNAIANVTVNVNALPTLTTSVSNSTICAGNSITLSVSGANTYTWSPIALNGATINISPSSTTIYTVLGTNTLTGCKGTSIEQISVNPNPIVTASVSSPTICDGNSTVLTATGSANSYTWSPGNLVGSSQPISPNVTTTYSVIGTNTITGCTTTSTVNLAVVANPTINTVVNPTVICSGNNGTLTATGADTYTWNPGNLSGNSLTVSPNASTIYTVIGTNTVTGCSNSTSSSISVISNPTVTIVSNPSVICAGDAATLTATGATTYTWMPGNLNVNSITVSPSSTTVYTVTGSSATCNDVKNTTLIVNSLPVVTATSSAVSICSSATSTLYAGGADTYTWMPGNFNGSPSIINPTSSTTYSVTGTNTLTGCSNISSIAIVVTDTPTLTTTASPSVICAGATATLSVTGATTYTWNPGNSFTSSVAVSPVSTTIYTVSGANGLCVTNNTISLNVVSNPTISVTGNTTICKGSKALLTASGVSSYTWSTGANTATINVTPTITTTYTISGEDANNCNNTQVYTVSVISSKSIFGNVTNTLAPTSGDVIIYKYSALLSKWDSVTIAPFSTSYSFSSIDSGLYVVRAIPTATDVQVTYCSSSLSWKDATIINHGCSVNSQQDIDLIPLLQLGTGPGVLSGVITQASGFGAKTALDQFKPLVPGGPIGGIIVKGGRNPGGQMFVQTETNAAGEYTLSGIPLNSGTDEYFIMVDIPGLDTNGTYHRTITVGNTSFSNLNFTVDSIYINPVADIVTGISNNDNVFENKIVMYPNPANNFVSIKYELIKSSKVEIELINVIGEKVLTVSNESTQEKNKYNHEIDLQNFSPGIYFVKLRINNIETLLKLIKSN
jgi:hypothetical protein